MSEGRIVFVDDDASMRPAVEQWLRLAGFSVDCFGAAGPALEALAQKPCDALVTDVRMPEISGMELLDRLRTAYPDLPVILITAHGDIATAVRAMRLGAYDFLEKPFDPDHLVEVLRKAVEKARLLAEVRALRARFGPEAALEQRLAGVSSQMRAVRQTVAELANIDADVIIRGETGTGKEVVARALHDFGHRASGPFVAVNCAAIPADIAESELFGHVAGAFTGAKAVRAGKFEHAHGGTLFLDEIESMPLGLQAKVLRTIQERSVVRLGANEQHSIDVRIVAAAKCDLGAASAAGQFRADLFYRLNTVEILLPPLRQRKADIPLLFEVFAAEAAVRHSREPRPAAQDDIARLLAHDWPGNVRELKTVAQRFALGLAATGRTVSAILDGPAAASLPPGAPLSDLVAAYERALIAAALAAHHGNIAAVMDALMLPRRTLNEKMARFGLDREQFLPGGGEGGERK
jgi:two-component system, NtrC family, C4-dicarboxylate transport response regulator DctD